MFHFTMKTFCNDEQLAKWMPKLDSYDIFGCYAQTEIGHGSDVNSLETTATFDHKTDEFVLHTPTITATKWWPGEMGLTANHAVVLAKIRIPEEDGDVNEYGNGVFIV